MKKLLIILFVGLGYSSFAQLADSALANNVTIHKDYRLAVLTRKEFEVNTAILKMKASTVKGFRLMVLNTSDKNYAFKVRAELLQKFPEQKPYMWFANPYIRIKFGNFRTKEEAQVYQKEISQMLDGATIYLIPEMIEVKPGKDFDPDAKSN
ncbi:MAG: SPOR domain-containing protein [Bacteroidota bacterium]|nr:SPOR domain-containing protein [Bacteroidota bacterium]